MLITAIITLCSPFAQAQNNFLVRATNYTSLTLAGASQTSFGAITNRIPMRQNRGSSWFISVVGTNTVTTNTVTVYFQASADGTNWTTTTPFSWTTTLSGTNTVINWTNFNIEQISNIRYLSPTIITNANASTNAIIVNFLYESHGSD